LIYEVHPLHSQDDGTRVDQVVPELQIVEDILIHLNFIEDIAGTGKENQID
jgi:hypothetical protein